MNTVSVRAIARFLALGLAVGLLACGGTKPLRAAEGPSGPETPLAEAKRLEERVRTLYQQGKYAEAVPLAQQVLKIREEGLGAEHADTAASLNDLAQLYCSLEDYAKAEPLYQRALKTREKVLGPEHPDTAESLNNLAGLYADRGDYAKAEPLYQRALRIREKVLAPEHADTATTLNDLATLYDRLGDYAKAEPLYQRALRILEKAVGPEHPDTAGALLNLAGLYNRLGDYAKAEPLYQRALKILEKVLGPEHLTTATCLNNVAGFYRRLGDYAKAEPLYQRALRIKEKVLGPDHPETALGLGNLGGLYAEMGDYAKAEPLEQRALGIFEKTAGPEHLDTAICLNDLADLYCAMQDYAKAEPLFQRALRIKEKTLGPEHASTATSLNNLAELYRGMRDYAKAEPLYQRALRITEKTLGPEHPDTAASLNNLAALYDETRDYAKAEPLHQRALRIKEKVLGPDHPDTAKSLNNLGVLYTDMGDWARAEPLYQRALMIEGKVLGPDHPVTAATLSNVARLYDAMGDSAKVEPLLRRGLAIMQRLVDLTSAVQSERQQLAMADGARAYYHNWLSAALRAGRSPEELAEADLRWKGQTAVRQRAAQQLRAALQASGDASARQLYEQLEAATRELATLALGKVEAGAKAEERLRRLSELTEQKEQLERELASRNTVFREQQRRANPTLADLRLALTRQPGAVLVDVIEYSHRSPPKAGKGKPEFEDRLLALVIRGDTKEVGLVELGLAKPINEAVACWREGLGIGESSRAAADHLRALVWQKLEPKLGGATNILLSPDGALCRLPFGALPGARPGSYLLEQYVLAVIPIPRLLPELLAGQRSGTNQAPSLLAVGEVDYGADPGAPSILPSGVLVAVARSAARPRGQGALPSWNNLPATRDEVLAVRDSFEQRFGGARVETLRKGVATEQRVRELAPQFRYLHLATHGYFADESMRSHFKEVAGRLGGGMELFGRQDLSGWNPGLLSGLVLAGANVGGQEGKDDGILTALEVQALDLGGVELAVLSACETGLGESAAGEGVLGLQRAFQIAGARTTVASLWKVPDQATRGLMSEFYRRMWEERKGKLEALREAQLWMLREGKGRGVKVEGGEGEGMTLPPKYWAAFVLSGDWR
jgi:CHAT domain-containing protein/tetratricopeptide (TPR) repeat protein